MKKIVDIWKIIVLDVLGVSFMVIAVALGWLPGPGGIPLFLVGLSLLAVNHEWAKRYIDILTKYADRIGDLIFIKNNRVENIYDATSPIVMTGGLLLLIHRGELWTIFLGIVMLFLGLTFLLGNRGRWSKLIRFIKKR